MNFSNFVSILYSVVQKLKSKSFHNFAFTLNREKILLFKHMQVVFKKQLETLSSWSKFARTPIAVMCIEVYYIIIFESKLRLTHMILAETIKMDVPHSIVKLILFG